jgi:predicted ester cyclase
MDFAATGRAIEYTGVTWCRIANGKIIEHQTWWDKAALLEQVTG